MGALDPKRQEPLYVNLNTEEIIGIDFRWQVVGPPTKVIRSHLTLKAVQRRETHGH